MGHSNQTLAALLHGRECPFGYQCKNTDCIECVKIRMEKGSDDGQKVL